MNGTRATRVRNMILTGAVLMIIGFLLGFIPQFRNVSRLEDQLRERDETIKRLGSETTLSKARDLAGLIYLELSRKNYGIAGQQAIALFDQVRALNAGSPQGKNPFNQILAQRESLLAQIAQADPQAIISVQQIADQLHQSANP